MRTNLASSVLAGSAGALALTAVHESVRRFDPRAPRMDLVAMRGLRWTLDSLGKRASESTLHRMALVGDVLSNTAYYALVGIGHARRAPMRGAVLGALAGIGALALPPHLGLGKPPHSASARNRVMTVAWYTIGGVVAGYVQRALARRRAQRDDAMV